MPGPGSLGAARGCGAAAARRVRCGWGWLLAVEEEEEEEEEERELTLGAAWMSRGCLVTMAAVWSGESWLMVEVVIALVSYCHIRKDS